MFEFIILALLLGGISVRITLTDGRTFEYIGWIERLTDYLS